MKEPNKHTKKRQHIKEWLCIEPGGANLPDEQFIIEAASRAEAAEAAAIYNAVVVRELTTN